MRIGVAWVPCHSVHYRAIFPVNAMARRGHELVVSPKNDGSADLRVLASCDVVHVYRRSDQETLKVLAALARSGTPITYDNDDDHTAVPKESPNYHEWSGPKGQRIFAATVSAARMARVFTTTNEVLAEKYRRAGVKRIEVIGNYLAHDLSRRRQQHEGVVIGWIAGGEHYADVARIRIVDALERVIAKHPHVRVECIGVDLRLPERYRHDAELPFHDLPGRIGGFDIGIAPLADIPMNWARSDIKVKEYAASGVPWLASPIGPYAGLGEKQGGRLASDDRWFEELDRLVAHQRERQQLGRNAEAWARGQTIEAVAHRWEDVFAEAVGKPFGPRIAVKPGVAMRIRPRARAS
jgi:glycosyltransferase involved in cell wall biosynthesis